MNGQGHRPPGVILQLLGLLCLALVAHSTGSLDMKPASPAGNGDLCPLCISRPDDAPRVRGETRPPSHLTIPDSINPHGDPNLCARCHNEGAEPDEDNVRIESCVECHQADAHLSEIHPTFFPGDHDLAPVFEGAPLLPDGHSTCITCHGISCRVDRANRAMLRGGPWPRESDFCFRCHQPERFQAINPHLETADANSCLLCHTAEIENETAGYRPGPGSLLPQPQLCLTCHKDVAHEGEHVGNSLRNNRLKRNSATTLERFMDRTGIELPLGPDDTILCSTCHDTSPSCGKTGEMTPAAHSRLLRAPKEQICYACHDL